MCVCVYACVRVHVSVRACVCLGTTLVLRGIFIQGGGRNFFYTGSVSNDMCSHNTQHWSQLFISSPVAQPGVMNIHSQALLVPQKLSDSTLLLIILLIIFSGTVWQILIWNASVLAYYNRSTFPSE